MYAKFTTSVKASMLIKSQMKLRHSGWMPVVGDSVVGDSVCCRDKGAIARNNNCFIISISSASD